MKNRLLLASITLVLGCQGAAAPQGGDADEWTEQNDPDCKNSGAEDQELPTKCWTQGDPPAEAAQGPKYTLPSGRFLNTNSIKAHIHDAGTAVVVGIDFFYQAWNHRLST